MPSKPITEEIFKKLLRETKKEPHKFIRERDSLMYKMLYYLGLRPGECRLIELLHINFEEHTIFIPAKNNKEKHEDDIWIPEFLFCEIEKYLENRNYQSNWLFPSYHHRKNPVGSRSSQRTFNERLKKLNLVFVSFIDKQGKPRYHINLYSFRKRFGTFVYKKTRDPKITANLLRHYDPQLKSVWRYVFWAERGERKQIMQELYSGFKKEKASQIWRERKTKRKPLKIISLS